MLSALLLAACAEEGANQAPAGADPVTWADVSAIFAASCNGCHAATPPTLDYATLSAGTGTCVTNGGAYIEPGDRALSCLYLVLTGDDGPSMGAAPYPTSATDVIGSWIDAGANP